MCLFELWFSQGMWLVVGLLDHRVALFLVFFFLFFLILKSLILTCVPKHEPLSHLPPHNISLGHPHAPAPSMRHPTSDMDWRFNSYMIVYMLEFPFSQIIPPSPSPSESKSLVYTSVSFLLSCKVSFNFMAAITICSDFGAPQNQV